MHIFNRLVMILLSLVLLVLGATTFLLLTGTIVPGNRYLRTILAMYTAYRAVALARGHTSNTAIIIAFLVGLVGLIVLVLELLPIGRLFRRPEGKPYVIRQDTVGDVTVDRSMVRDLVEHEATSLPGVVRAEPHVQDGPDGLRIAVHASLAWDADALSVGQSLQERIKDSVQTHLGLPVAQVQVTATRELLTETKGPRSRRHTPRVA